MSLYIHLLLLTWLVQIQFRVEQISFRQGQVYCYRLGIQVQILEASALFRNRHSADYTEVETMPKLSLKYRRYRGFRLNISA